MSTFRKDRNNIYISLNGRSGEYRLDLSTGVFYGIKGNPVKTCPSGEIAQLFNLSYEQRNTSDYPNLIGMLYTLFNTYGLSNTAKIRNYIAVMGGAEKLDALKVHNGYCYSTYDYEWANENIAEISKWIKANPDIPLLSMSTVRMWSQWEKDKKKLGAEFDLITAEMWNTIKQYRWSDEERVVAAYYLGRGKMWEYHHGNLNMLSQYFEYCRKMNKKPQKVNNFMREYVETQKEYEIRKIEFDKKAIADNYAKHSKAWEFEYGKYKIVIPTEPNDIIDEGRNMCHCVGSYVQNVIDNTTYIVFVRPIDNPNKCYITCQVHNSGRIGQYFLSHDRYISSDEDKEFYNAFSEHLKKVWNE